MLHNEARKLILEPVIRKKHLGNPVEGKLFCLGSVEIIKHS